jgi:hypothetical protein
VRHAPLDAADHYILGVVFPVTNIIIIMVVIIIHKIDIIVVLLSLLMLPSL